MTLTDVRFVVKVSAKAAIKRMLKEVAALENVEQVDDAFLEKAASLLCSAFLSKKTAKDELNVTTEEQAKDFLEDRNK